MACKCSNLQTLAGLALDCATNIGGIKRVFLRQYADDAFTVSGDTVTGINTGATTASTVAYYEYCFRKNTSEYNQTLTVSDNGNRFVQHSLSLVFPRMEATKRAEMMALTYGDVNAVVEDANGKYWAIPQEEPVSATEGSGATGVQKSDSNQYAITLGCETSVYAYELTAEAVTALLALVG